MLACGAGAAARPLWARNAFMLGIDGRWTAPGCSGWRSMDAKRRVWTAAGDPPPEPYRRMSGIEPPPRCTCGESGCVRRRLYVPAAGSCGGCCVRPKLLEAERPNMAADPGFPAAGSGGACCARVKLLEAELPNVLTVGALRSPSAAAPLGPEGTGGGALRKPLKLPVPAAGFPALKGTGAR